MLSTSILILLTSALCIIPFVILPMDYFAKGQPRETTIKRIFLLLPYYWSIVMVTLVLWILLAINMLFQLSTNSKCLQITKDILRWRHAWARVMWYGDTNY